MATSELLNTQKADQQRGPGLSHRVSVRSLQSEIPVEEEELAGRPRPPQTLQGDLEAPEERDP